MCTEQKMRLASICEIQLGHTARGRLEPVQDGGVRAIQLRDTYPEGGLGPIGQYLLGTIPERYWACPGDILFRSRGDRNTATALLAADFKEPAVAVMPLVILRPNAALADPAYVAWYINQPAAQRYFDGCARGTGMRMIPVGCLADLELPLPDLMTQRSIAEVDRLARREFSLVTSLAEKQRELARFALLDRARGHSQRLTRRAESRPKKEGNQ